MRNDETNDTLMKLEWYCYEIHGHIDLRYIHIFVRHSDKHVMIRKNKPQQ